MRRWFEQESRRAATVGLAALLLVTLTYPAYANIAARPLAVFVLPGLLTAVIGGWRPTLLVGLVSMVVAVVIGISGNLTPQALLARWLIIAIVVVVGAVGAAVRQRQADRIAELDRTVLLLEAFELGLAPTPDPPAGFVAVTRYRPAETRLRLGGDFLEAIALPGGRLAVLIGDVCGHGAREAALGAALRAGWRGIVSSTEQDPATWMTGLDDAFFHRGKNDTHVTVLTGLLDQEAGLARFVNAGHPTPLAITRSVHELVIPPSPPLGLELDVSWRATDLPWRGEPLLLYTDGLVENPRGTGPPDRWGEQGLVGWLHQHGAWTDPDDLLDELMLAGTAGRELRDDVALMLVGAAGYPTDQEPTGERRQAPVGRG